MMVMALRLSGGGLTSIACYVWYRGAFISPFLGRRKGRGKKHVVRCTVSFRLLFFQLGFCAFLFGKVMASIRTSLYMAGFPFSMRWVAQGGYFTALDGAIGLMVISPTLGVICLTVLVNGAQYL